MYRDNSHHFAIWQGVLLNYMPGRDLSGPAYLCQKYTEEETETADFYQATGVYQ
jgi:hypothetical protein